MRKMIVGGSFVRASILSIALSGSSFSVCADDTQKPYLWANALALESITNLQGGAEKGTRNLAHLDVTLAVNTEAAGWWEHGKLFVYLLGDSGKNPSDVVGDAQGISNIAAPNAFKLFEFWYEHSFAGDAVKVLFGLHDLNSTFYSLESAGLFTNSSSGIGAEVAQVGPSIFPESATTLHLTITKNSFYTLAAVYDGIPGNPEKPRGTHVEFNKGDGVFSALESGFIKEKSFKVGVGVWRHTAQVESPIDSTPSRQNNGFYIIAEKSFSDNFTSFVQFGKANKNKNQFDSYFGAGMAYNNALKEEDALGFAVSSAHNGAPFLEVNPDLTSRETITELTYQRPVYEYVAVQTSLYYVAHPSMMPTQDNALAIGLRLNIEF